MKKKKVSHNYKKKMAFFSIWKAAEERCGSVVYYKLQIEGGRPMAFKCYNGILPITIIGIVGSY